MNVFGHKLNYLPRVNKTEPVADTYYYYRTTGAIDFRAKNIESFDSVEKNSIDLYASVKSLYLQDRNKKINNSKSIIETQNDSDWEEVETN